jgi:DNA-directed RNA polymerase specialized sigma24 family protein
MKRDAIDFFAVHDRHLEIHARLEAWGRWVRVRPQGWQTQPIFMQYRSKSWQWERPTLRAEPNLLETVAMEKAVAQLPQKHRDALRWSYVFGGGPVAMARRLGVSKEGLMELIHAGRTMLVNRGA